MNYYLKSGKNMLLRCMWKHMGMLKEMKKATLSLPSETVKCMVNILSLKIFLLNQFLCISGDGEELSLDMKIENLTRSIFLPSGVR